MAGDEKGSIWIFRSRRGRSSKQASKQTKQGKGNWLVGAAAAVAAAARAGWWMSQERAGEGGTETPGWGGGREVGSGVGSWWLGRVVGAPSYKVRRGGRLLQLTEEGGEEPEEEAEAVAPKQPSIQPYYTTTLYPTLSLLLVFPSLQRRPRRDGMNAKTGKVAEDDKEEEEEALLGTVVHLVGVKEV